MQAQEAGPEAVREVLACGKVCHRLLEACPHLCEASCHAGPCSSECSALVTVSATTAAPTPSTHRLAMLSCRAPPERIAMHLEAFVVICSS